MDDPPRELNPESSDLIVRPAESEDLAELMRLLAQLHEEEVGDVTPTLRATYADMLESPFRTILIACSSHGTVLGTLDLILVPNLTRGGRPWAAIENMVVDRFHRRHGIGKALLGNATELAEGAGCYKLQLVSHARRDAAHDFYESSGFDAPVVGFRRYLGQRQQ